MALFVVYRLENGWKVRQKCDKFRKNLFCATVCALVLYALPISYGCIMGCVNPLLDTPTCEDVPTFGDMPSKIPPDVTALHGLRFWVRGNAVQMRGKQAFRVWQ